MGPTVARGGGRACKHLMQNASLCILKSKSGKARKERETIVENLRANKENLAVKYASH
jgi:hypothetical protein